MKTDVLFEEDFKKPMSLLNEIKELARESREEIIAIRHHIHAHPELSFHEKETADFISQKLTAYGLPHQRNVGGYGITGLIQSSNQGPAKVVALRAELDALPITEKNQVDYRSKNDGVMHACGHDVHASALLGALKILDKLKHRFPGTVKFIFQPAEEKLPGGASLMIKDGVLENPKPDVIIAQHVFTPLKAGTAGFRGGMYMASADEIYITVKGKGGHAAEPKNVINPVFGAARLLAKLEELMAALAQATIPTIMTFGKITGAGATNVIPDEVTIDGTLRTMDENWRKQVHDKIRRVVSGFSENDVCKADVNIETGYPCLVNDEKITGAAKELAEEYLGKENIKDLDIRMASEDFAFYSQQTPSCFYRIGTGNPEKGITSSVHTPTFNIDEEALEIASGMMAWIAINLLTAAR